MAQQSARRGRENQGFPQRFEHASGEMDPARELPYRPAAAQRRIRGRTDGSIRLRAKAIPKFPLARKGASTDGLPTLAEATVNGAVALLSDVTPDLLIGDKTTHVTGWMRRLPRGRRLTG